MPDLQAKRINPPSDYNPEGTVACPGDCFLEVAVEDGRVERHDDPLTGKRCSASNRRVEVAS